MNHTTTAIEPKLKSCGDSTSHCKKCHRGVMTKMGFHHGMSDRNATATSVHCCKYGMIHYLDARGVVYTKCLYIDNDFNVLRPCI
jgi:hypothetical protein